MQSTRYLTGDLCQMACMFVGFRRVSGHRSVSHPLRTPVDRRGPIPQSGRRPISPCHARDPPPLPTCMIMHKQPGQTNGSAACGALDRADVLACHPASGVSAVARDSGQCPDDPFGARDRQGAQPHLHRADTPTACARRPASPSTVKPWFAPAATSTAS